MGRKADRLQDVCAAFGSTIKSTLKFALLARPCTHSGKPLPLPLIILANGPSLKENLIHDGDVLERFPLLAVNFALNNEAIEKLHPEYYVLADPLFFQPQAPDNVRALMQKIAQVSWPMTLWLPAQVRVPKGLKYNSRLKLCRYNLIAAEGFRWFRHLAFSLGLGMPRPRNVLIPSLMVALRMGYRTIYILGADHSWTKTLDVDNHNHVISVQPHFYADSASELERQRVDYLHRPMHEVLRNFQITFESYHALEPYARKIGATIINATPGSFIDAFERGELPR